MRQELGPFSLQVHTSIGKRPRQEDSADGRVFLRQNSPVALGIVADGMGGEKHTKQDGTQVTGTDASRRAVSVLMGLVNKLQSSSHATHLLLQHTIKDAGTAVFRDCNEGNDGNHNVGTTIAAAVVRENGSQAQFPYTARFAAIGDSPVFVVKGPKPKLTRLTRDEHFIAPYGVEAKNILANSLGSHPTTKIAPENIGEVHLPYGSQILLTSDGVSSAVYGRWRNYDGLEAFLRHRRNWNKVTSQRSDGTRVLDAGKLVKEATRRKENRDNATALVITMR